MASELDTLTATRLLNDVRKVLAGIGNGCGKTLDAVSHARRAEQKKDQPGSTSNFANPRAESGQIHAMRFAQNCHAGHL